MVFIYCKTNDSPLMVGEVVCRANSIDETTEKSWIMKELDDDGSCIIEAKCNSSAVAVIYPIGKEVIGIEIEDECASKVVEPLLESYGFENVKWLLTK